jgi:hypothetical protein
LIYYDIYEYIIIAGKEKKGRKPYWNVQEEVSHLNKKPSKKKVKRLFKKKRENEDSFRINDKSL